MAWRGVETSCALSQTARSQQAATSHLRRAACPSVVAVAALAPILVPAFALALFAFGAVVAVPRRLRLGRLALRRGLRRLLRRARRFSLGRLALRRGL